MRVLIDECVDPRVKQILVSHVTATVHECGWGGLEDGPLLKTAQDHFDVFLTIDRNLEFQQNVANLRIGLVVVQVLKNQLIHYVTMQEQILAAIKEARHGRIIHVVPQRSV